MRPYAVLLVFINPYGFLLVLMASNGSLWVLMLLIRPYTFF